MKSCTPIIRVILGMAATAAILFAVLGTGYARNAGDFDSRAAEALRDSITVQLEARNFPAAVALSHDLVEGLEQVGAAPDDLASGLETLARSLRRGGDASQPETLDVARQAVAVCRENPGVTPGTMAASLNTLALILYQRSDNQEALDLFEEATGLWAAEFGSDNQRVAAGLNNQGLVLEALGSNEEARRVLEQAWAIYASRGDESAYKVKQAQTSMVLAKLEMKLGNYEQAWERGQASIETYRETLGPDHPLVGGALGDLAALARTTGDLEGSRKLYEEALPILENGYGPAHAEVGRALNNLGNLYADQGRIADARVCFERALAITRKVEGPESPQTAVRLLNLASILAELGDLELARAHLLQAEEIFRTRLGDDHIYMGYAKQELGGVLAELGQVDTGLARLNSARAIFERRLGSDHVVVAELLNQSGSLLIDQGRYAKADTQLSRGLDLVREKFPAGHPLTVSLLLNKGRWARLVGDPRASLVFLQEGLALGNRILDPDHPDVAALHLESGRVLAELHQPEEAFDQAMLAEGAGRHHFILAAVAFEEDIALTMATRRVSGLGLGAELALARGQGPERGEMVHRFWDEVIRSRGLVGEIMALRRRMDMNAPGNSDSALADSLSLRARDYAQLIVAGPGESTPVEYAAALESARALWNRLDRRLAGAGGAYSRMATLLAGGLDDVVARLPANGALVSYLAYQAWDDSLPQMAALVMRSPGEAPDIIGLGPATVIEVAVARWRYALQSGVETEDRALSPDGSSAVAAGRAVSRLIWEPLGLGNGEGTVFIVPDGVLNFVDFHTLPRAAGGFLIENPGELRVISSVRDLLTAPRSHAGESGALLAMGGADFGITDKGDPWAPGVGRGGYGSLVFTDLPESRREAQGVSDLWRELGAGPAYCLVGSQASEGAFKSKARECHIAHLATHGFFLAGDAIQGRQGTRGVGALTPDTGFALRGKSINPLLLSGLAFSGANLHGAGKEAEDGILTAYEVAAMDLGDLDLAVLSACQSGDGDLRDGEGVMGLRRAFATAGVANLVMSLGGVRDDTARIWMASFYRAHLSQGLDYQQAARSASRTLLAHRRQAGLTDDPAFWAPFIAVGPGH